MDSASKKEDNDSLVLAYLHNLSPLSPPPPVKTHHNRLSSYSLLDNPDPATLFENLNENPCGSEKVSEEALLSYEEPKIVQQEKPAYVDEPGKIQDVEWPFQECRGVEFNLFAEHAENEWQNHQEFASQLKPAPLQDVRECEDCGEMGPPLHISSENRWRDGSEGRGCFQDERAASNALGCDEIGDCELVENPFGFMKLCEDHLLLPEEYYNTIHPAYVDKQMKIQDVERPSQDCATPQLMPKSALNVTECGNWGEMWSALYSRAQNMLSHGTEINYYNQFEETASNSVEGTICSLDAHSPDDSISSADLSSVSRDLLIEAVEALNSTSIEMHMLKLSKDSEPITSSNPSTVHNDNEPQPTSIGSSEEFNQLMARQENRKTTMPATYRCECKKSEECIRPRCGCFAAQIYCNSFCYCRGCLNRGEYEDKNDHKGRKNK